MNKGVGFVPSLSVLDHLAPMAYILQIPLLIDEKKNFQLTQKMYPNLPSYCISNHQVLLEHVAHTYDTLFFSSSNYLRDLSPLFEIFFRKKMHFWYCPHGNSDKSLAFFKDLLFTFVYGKQMEKRLIKLNLFSQLKKVITTGNYRLLFYHLFQDFYDDLAEKEVFSQFPKKQKVLLCAPTWHKKGHPVFKDLLFFMDKLSPQYNLIIKLHPWTLSLDPELYFFLKQKEKQHPNVLLLDHFPPIYPLLKRTDIFLGDHSSIGYDFLYFERPMFFFPTRQPSSLSQCGMQLTRKEYTNFRFLCSPSSLTQKQRKLYSFAFDKESSFFHIQKETECF